MQATDIYGCICEDQLRLTIINEQIEPTINDFSAEILPNPNNGKFTLYINNPDIKNSVIYEIYSPVGKLTLRKKAESLKEEVNLQNKAGGSYLLKVINGNTILNKVIIVAE